MSLRIIIDTYINLVDITAAALIINEGDLGPRDRIVIEYLTKDNEKDKN